MTQDDLTRAICWLGAAVLALLWVMPLLYAAWTAFHPVGYEARFQLTAPVTLDNFRFAWAQAPFQRYFLNTVLLVAMILSAQLVLCTLAAFAFARLEFPGRNLLFALVLVQLTIMPDILIVENFRIMAALGLVDTILAIGLPYFASAFAIFLLRQSFRQVPHELDQVARLEGYGTLGVIWRVYVPLSLPTYLAFGLVSVSSHWNNYLWPLIITSSVETRPLTVGLSVFATTDASTPWAIVNAATLMTTAPLLIAFLLFQRQFVQNFARAGIK